MTEFTAVGSMNQKAVTRIATQGRPTWRSVTLIWVGTLLLLFIANLAVAYLLQMHPLNSANNVLRLKWLLLQKMDHPVDWVIVGDSSANYIAMPDILAKGVGGECVNLAVPGAIGSQNSPWILEKYIQRWGRPKGVILMTSVNMWEVAGMPTAVGHIPLSLREISRFEPPPFTTPGRLFAAISSRYLPLYTDNKTLEKFIQRPWEPVSDILRYTPREDGFTPLLSRDRNFDLSDQDIQKYLDHLDQKTTWIEPYCWAGLEELGRMSRRYGFKVLVVNAPVDTETFHTPSFQRYLTRINRYVRGFVDRQPRWAWVPVDVTYPVSDFHSRDHLLYPQTIAFNEYLAGQIDRSRHIAPRSSREK